MTYSVTSWFLSQLAAKGSEPKRVFTIGNSDYSDYVVTWPTIRKTWDDVRPKSASVKCANDDGAFLFLQQNKALMASQCFLKLGFTHPSSGDELISLYGGYIDQYRYVDGTCVITLLDKFKVLGERLVGDKDAPITFTDSTLPSDIAWAAVTSYGGLSALASSSNPDINYPAFLAWAAVFSADQVYMNGRCDGVKASEVLQKLARLTDSAIYVEENKLNFHRFSALDSNQSTFTTANLTSPVEVSVDGADIVNRQYVYGAYDVDSDYYGVQVVSEITASVNTYGAREQIEKDDKLWYVNSIAALNLAARITTVAGEPYEKITVKTPLLGALRQIGETIVVDEPFYEGGVSGGYRVMGTSVNMDKGTFDAEVMRAIVGQQGFTLDVSTLDGPDLLY